MWIDEKEIAVAYFRTGYIPSNYVDNSYEGWLLIEKSAAIKCPNIDLQLVTFKKVQEALASEENWNEVLGQDFNDLKSLFIGGNWGFENLDEVRNVIDDCKVNPKQYVLKT